LQHDSTAKEIIVDVSVKEFNRLKLRRSDIRYVAFDQDGLRAYPSKSLQVMKDEAA
jgi:iron(III) transport system ATP-binding protein